MPITKSAKKALRQSIRRRERNLKVRQALKALLQRVRAWITEKNQGEATKLLPLLFQSLDKAAKQNIIAKNKASRYKSRLSKRIAKLSS